MVQADVVTRQTPVDDDPDLIGYSQMTSRSPLCPLFGKFPAPQLLPYSTSSCRERRRNIPISFGV